VGADTAAIAQVSTLAPDASGAAGGRGDGKRAKNRASASRERKTRIHDHEGKRRVVNQETQKNIQRKKEERSRRERSGREEKDGEEKESRPVEQDQFVLVERRESRLIKKKRLGVSRMRGRPRGEDD
jgi:hypothetical protein